MARSRPGVSEAHREQWGRTYERTPYRDLPWFSPRPYGWLRRAVAERWFRPGTRVLDIGCGAGTNSLFLARAGFRVSGVDLAPRAIEAARRRARSLGLQVDFRAEDALRLPYRDRSFGAMVDVGCFHTLPIPLRGAYSRELGRVLRPRGSYLLSWIGREATQEFGPPHRPSVEEAAATFEEQFVFRKTEYEARFAVYHALLERRSSPQPPRR